MFVNSLIMGLITYTVSIIYNLLDFKSLDIVFYLGLRFLVYSTLLTLFLQLSYYLSKDILYQDQEVETDSKQEEKRSDNKESENEKNSNSNADEAMSQEFEESTINNEFGAAEDDEGFSALNPEELDYQQNINQ